MPDFKYNGKIYYNPVQLVMEQIAGIWKAPILWRLKDQTMRYGEFVKTFSYIRQNADNTAKRIRRRRLYQQKSICSSATKDRVQFNRPRHRYYKTYYVNQKLWT